jgi:hypothetical protein
MAFGQDENGLFKLLDDGRVLRVAVRTFGKCLLTVSESVDSPGWEHGW